ncbi:GNAT family N-acetyltransferase [Paenibacillus glycanilyticus]|uniref:N-acetyltransferase YkwB n=1 Tax=Paenibacillus glycanilyticus TaxID=126569 RepID=A0ABQ6GDC8_9BACL|nr:GNAT family N-acetyltransferase [Paenibacillus glycanilyticus]GLX68110.1 putative N-acetyltransferase YkwB [Paenibacillus glycanilyticus]
MRKQLYIIHDGKPTEVTIRSYTSEDFTGLIAVQSECFPPPYPEELWWSKEQLTEHITRFPEGALCCELGGRVIGSMTGLIVDMNQYHGSHSWEQITDSGYIRNHNPNGDTLYVADIAVIPAYRKAGIGKWLLQSMYETVVHLQLKRLLGAGRMPYYHKYAAEESPEQYLEKVMNGIYQDPVITFLLRCGRTPVGIASDYLDDEESCNYAALMEWRNPFL